jgi:hypothetical protein
MYIPVTYWNSQLATRADLNINYFATSFSGVPQNFSYTYDGITLSGSCTKVFVATPVCMDVVNMENIVRSNVAPVGSTFFCNASFSGSSQCCISSYPNTGVEAWYIDVSYFSNLGDEGLQYYNYIDVNGNIVNDSIGFGQTKRIVSQCNPMTTRDNGNFYGVYVGWEIVSKFPGQVLAYPYKDVPCDYTLTLKRDSASNPGYYGFGYITYKSLANNNGFFYNNESASIIVDSASTLNGTIVISSSMPPLNQGSNNNGYGSSIWITNVTPKAKGALLLSSCVTTHSLWVTLDDYDYYNTGSVLKVTNTELTTTSSCWTVNSVTSSLSTTIALTNVNISQSYGAAQCPECAGATRVIATGGITGSFVSGSTLYSYNAFTSNGQFTIMSGSITDAKIMVIAGGGGGGANGGGGAGGLVYSSSVSLNLVGPNDYYSVSVGQGGAAYNGTSYNQNAANGTNSTFVGTPYNITAIGGGKGASYLNPGTTDGGDGGSGGGGNVNGSPGTGTAGQGFNGGSYGIIGIQGWSGGGGGAGGSGGTRFPGPGIQLGSLMLGVSASYSAGGGLADFHPASTTSGSGGLGGGGAAAGQTGRNGLVVITYPAYTY